MSVVPRHGVTPAQLKNFNGLATIRAGTRAGTNIGR
jgi:hypothetical protein